MKEARRPFNWRLCIHLFGRTGVLLTEIFLIDLCGPASECEEKKKAQVFASLLNSTGEVEESNNRL